MKASAPMSQIDYENRRHRALELLALCDGVRVRLADRIGKDASYVSRVLSEPGAPGHKNISEEFIRASALAFDLTPGWFDMAPGTEMPDAGDGRVSLLSLVKNRGAASPSFQIDRDVNQQPESEDVGRPRTVRPTRVVGTAKLGENGYYDETPDGDGWVEHYTSNPNVYALRVKGDSMHPAIRHGTFVVVDPDGRCAIGEYVAIALLDGRKMVKELVMERADEVVIESVNGNHRQTIERSLIHQMHPVVGQVPASKWRAA